MEILPTEHPAVSWVTLAIGALGVSIACQRQGDAEDSENEDGDSDPERSSLPTRCRDLLFPKPSDGKVALDVGPEVVRPRAHGLTPERLELGPPLTFVFSG